MVTIRFKSGKQAKTWFSKFILKLMPGPVGFYLRQFSGTISIYSTDPNFQLSFNTKLYDINKPEDMWINKWEGGESPVIIQAKYQYIHEALYSLESSIEVCKKDIISVGGKRKNEFLKIFQENRREIILEYNDFIERIMQIGSINP